MNNNQLFGVIYKSTILVPESSFYGKFVIGMRQCKSLKQFYNKKPRYVGSSTCITRVKNKYGDGLDKIKTEVIYCMFDNDIQTHQEKHKQLGDWEKHFIELHESYTNQDIGMNLTPGGDGGDTWSCMTKEKQDKKRKMLSVKNKIKEIWKNKTEEEKQTQIQNRKNTISNWSEEKIKKLKEERKQTLLNRSEEEKKEVGNNISNGHKKQTIEKKQEISKRMSDSQKNSEKKRETIKRKKEDGSYSITAKNRTFDNICIKCNIKFKARGHHKDFCNDCELYYKTVEEKFKDKRFIGRKFHLICKKCGQLFIGTSSTQSHCKKNIINNIEV